MAKNRTPQTFEKRKRERDKQVKREAKQAERRARNAAKRTAKQDDTAPGGPVPGMVPGMANYTPDDDPRSEFSGPPSTAPKAPAGPTKEPPKP